MPAGRTASALALVALVALVAGCAEELPPAMPEALLGSYDVEVAADGERDPTLMTVSLGSDGSVLLGFASGISIVRGRVFGATELVLPRQTIRVAHASGAREGLATGGGTITEAGAVDVTIHLGPAGLTPDAGAAVDYRITGQRR